MNRLKIRRCPLVILLGLSNTVTQDLEKVSSQDSPRFLSQLFLCGSHLQFTRHTRLPISLEGDFDPLGIGRRGWKISRKGSTKAYGTIWKSNRAGESFQLSRVFPFGSNSVVTNLDESQSTPRTTKC